MKQKQNQNQNQKQIFRVQPLRVRNRSEFPSHCIKLVYCTLLVCFGDLVATRFKCISCPRLAS